VRNYRSLRNVDIDTERLTVVVGANGSGKSNLYRAIGLLSAAADGRLASTLLAEGGMPSALHAGSRSVGPVRLVLGAHVEGYNYELQLGLPQGNKPFDLDPLVTSERVWIGPKPTKHALLCERENRTALLRPEAGDDVRIPSGLATGESILAQIGEPARFPELWLLREHLRNWRFYHHFDTGPAAPARHPQPGVLTRVLASDGHDLAAALATIEHVDNADFLHEVIGNAFPGRRLVVDARGGTFAVSIAEAGLQRPLTAVEFSDGTLRFLCLAAALLTTNPPGVLVVNEPETSLHPDLYRPLAALIAEAATKTQVWVSTHSAELAQLLGATPETNVVALEIVDGETVAEPR
jgi:predicted ATPase